MDDIFDLSGQTALITGSTKGIGKAIAARMAQYGANVVVSSRKADVCDAVAEEINRDYAARGGSAIAIPCHVSHKDQLQNLVSQTEDRLGPIDILVPNAAVNPYYGPSKDIPDTAWDKIMETNVRSTFWLCNMVIPGMAERGKGAVTIIASISGLQGVVEIGAYAVSKVAEQQLARNLALEYGPEGVRVNAIAPGVIKTDFAKALWTDPVRLEAANSRLPLRRFGDPNEVAGVALFLSSKAGGYMTGQIINVDGGAAISP
jgi:dehydrogenase/reductase SDR family protein 4